MKKLLLSLALTCLCASLHAQVFPYFGPANGILKGTTSSGITSAASASDLASLASCTANQVLFTNSTPALACATSLQYAASPGTLTEIAAGPAAIEHWTNSNGHTDQKDWDFFFTANGNADLLEGRLLNAAGSSTDNWLLVSRNGIDSGACQITGTVNPYQVCQIELCALSCTEFINMFDNILTFAGNANDSYNVAYTNTNIGTLAFTQNTITAGNNTTTHSAKIDLEVVPQSATGNSGFCNTVDGALLTLPYTCLAATFHYELAVSGSKNSFLNLAHVIQSTNSSGTITTSFGDSFNSGDITNVLGGGITTRFASGHMAFSGTTPAVSSCGTSPSIDANATDVSGTVTVGTVSATSCTITFATAFTTWNHCRITSQNNVTALAYSYTLSAITVTATSLVSDKLDYDCDGS